MVVINACRIIDRNVVPGIAALGGVGALNAEVILHIGCFSVHEQSLGIGIVFAGGLVIFERGTLQSFDLVSRIAFVVPSLGDAVNYEFRRIT